MNSKTIVITVRNQRSGYKGAMVESNGKNRYHYNLTAASWNRLEQVCKGKPWESMTVMPGSVTTKYTL